MTPPGQPLPMPSARGTAAVRVDAARNRTSLLVAARRLIAECGVERVTMDDVATAAGVGKGTLFRRFGSRAGLLLVLLDEDAQSLQHDMMFGPPPLGPGAPPVRRLAAYGRRRMRFNLDHRGLLADARAQPHARHLPAATVERRHITMLLDAAGTTGDLDAQAEALLAVLDGDYLAHRVTAGASLEDLELVWDAMVAKVCGG